ncbi:replication restart helicase PriA [Candidatus Gromoviella agglomerans]|uniref:replication restart helicase PriA n=1 Tax=Candidatus Gromoviella agglomerans TaxID=2806609 RepID=UPI001E43B06E|nr:primosomal protein N' [Candidatus Gromoviella agglomerans]UFX98382.1 Primosomal protein N' [Candidatus Gromoviella agglomerans]
MQEFFVNIIVLSSNKYLSKLYTYKFNEHIPQGTLVVVQFGRKYTLGIVLGHERNNFIRDIKFVQEVLPINLSFMLNFLQEAAANIICEVNQIARMVVPFKYNQIKNALKQYSNTIESDNSWFDIPIALSDEQKTAVNKMMNSSSKVFLLHGITGSGKTEVYFEIAREILKIGKQILILVPEIALINQTLKRFKSHFKILPTIWHSSQKKSKDWLAAYFGHAKVIIGVRSAVFLPLPNVELIIIDEEHDASYKQDSQIIYHARDIAILRSKYSQNKLILGSATPCIESLIRSQSKISENLYESYEYISLKTKFHSTSCNISIVDMSKEKRGLYLSSILRKAIKENIQNNKQALLFLNKRGYSPIILCTSCKTKIMCAKCKSWMVFFLYDRKLKCTYCEYNIDMPKSCSVCNKESLIPCGPGIERLKEEVFSFLPDARVEILSSDTQEQQTILQKMHNQEIDIIIGTQILSKGHDFKNLALVAMIDADAGIYGADMRSMEKTYQLLTQVCGRTGRHIHGEIYVQTFFPEDKRIQYILYEPQKFLANEIEARQDAKLPPFSSFIAIILKNKNSQKVYEHALIMSQVLEEKFAEFDQIEILGPVKSPLHIINEYYRWRFLIIQKTENKKQYVSQIIYDTVIKIRQKGTFVQIDVNPQSFL